MEDASSGLGLIAVIAAALIGYVSSMVQESRRRRHEDEAARREREQQERRRLQDLRFEVYVKMTTEANRVHALVKHPTAGGIDVKKVNDAYESFDLTLSPAFMLASDRPSQDAIAGLVRSVRDLAEAVIDADRDGEEVDVMAPDFLALLRAHRRAVRVAERVMRRELGITDGDATAPGPDAFP